MNRNQLRMRQSETRGYGKMHFDKQPKPKMVNTRTCPKCGAKPGATCVLLTETVFRELSKTHTGHEVPQDQYREKTAQPTALELERRKKSTEILDRRYKAKKAREAERKDRANGIRRPSDPMK